jgi:ribosome biogenesis GTPase / thiamine phosphate phosphatase
MNQTELKQVFIDLKYFLNETNAFEGYQLTRVVEQQKDIYKLMDGDGKLLQARVSGRIMHQSIKASDYPAVGDWVIIEKNSETSIIHHIIERKSILERKSAGLTSEAQLIATNLDVIFICMSANENFNLRRLERYLSVCWSSGATPVIILTKIDLSTNLSSLLSNLHQVSFGVDILLSSEFMEPYFKNIESYLEKDLSYCFIGSSGVGKSTIVNHLLELNVQKTIQVGDHDKGRHSTTSRKMFFTENGAIIIDTPGMRELQLDEADIETTFMDIEEISKSCKFNDCKHEKEPGCAVKEAIHQGILSIERLQHYHKLNKELEYQKLKAKRLEIKLKKK